MRLAVEPGELAFSVADKDSVVALALGVALADVHGDVAAVLSRIFLCKTPTRTAGHRFRDGRGIGRSLRRKAFREEDNVRVFDMREDVGETRLDLRKLHGHRLLARHFLASPAPRRDYGIRRPLVGIPNDASDFPRFRFEICGGDG